MQKDFHYNATYCAAYLAGYSHEESLQIASAAQFTDLCSVTLLNKLNAPAAAATTQLQSELMNQRTDLIGLQEITRIWSSFHFLPYDLHAESGTKSRVYLAKYRLICKPNGALVRKTVELVKGQSLAAVGIAMHVLADTWAHSYFAGTPSFVINNTNSHFYELLPEGNGFTERRIHFHNNLASPDNLEKGYYNNSLLQVSEISVMNLGHGRAGHLPDYSFMRYKYLPAWGNYNEIIKDNPSDYYHAFCQMVQAMRFLRGEIPAFDTNQYAYTTVMPFDRAIHTILETRQPDSSKDWKRFGESLSGSAVPDFNMQQWITEYQTADKKSKEQTFLGHFFHAAMAQKEMVTDEIFCSGNLMAGISSRNRSSIFTIIKDHLLPAGTRKEDKS